MQSLRSGFPQSGGRSAYLGWWLVESLWGCNHPAISLSLSTEPDFDFGFYLIRPLICQTLDNCLSRLSGDVRLSRSNFFLSLARSTLSSLSVTGNPSESSLSRAFPGGSLKFCYFIGTFHPTATHSLRQTPSLSDAFVCLFGWILDKGAR